MRVSREGDDDGLCCGSRSRSYERRKSAVVMAVIVSLMISGVTECGGESVTTEPRNWDVPLRETPKPIYEVRLPRYQTVPRMSGSERSGLEPHWEKEDDKWSSSSEMGQCEAGILTLDQIFEDALVETIVTANKQRLRCKVPSADAEHSQLERNSRRMDPVEEAEQLLSVYTGKCFIMPDKWWKYRFCFQKSVVQEHKARNAQEETQTFYLGNFVREENTKGDQEKIWERDNQHSELYTGGTPCDLTSRPRQIRVKYVCGSTLKSKHPGIPVDREYVQTIHELMTCEYELIFVNEAICEHSWYQKKKQKDTLKIVCDLEEGEEPFAGLGSKNLRRMAWI